MTTKELKPVFGPAKAKHLLFGNSLLKHWTGERDGVGFDLEYAVYSEPGATLEDLLKMAEDVLGAIPEDDKEKRTCIVQVNTF